MRKRRAARVLIFGPSGSILLMRLAIPQGSGEDFVFWIAPGGEIEGEEMPIEAARREINEELGLDLAMEGPIRIDQNSFIHQGEPVDNTDYFFLAHCERDAPKMYGVTPEEIAIMKEIRWWTVDELEDATQTIFPQDLTALVRALSNRRKQR